jgi:hypothetical protein
LLGRTTPQSWLVEDHVQLVSFLFATLFFNQEVLPSGKQTSLWKSPFYSWVNYFYGNFH